LLGKRQGCASPYAAVDCPPAAAPEPVTPPAPTPFVQAPSAPFTEALASAGEAGTQPAASYMPAFFGDLLASSIFQQVFIPEQGRTTVIGSPNATQAGSIKLAEGDSPRPTDRLYYTYNFFGNVEVNIPDPTAPPHMQVSRHTIGFEKTFLDEHASVGMRLPFFSMGGDSVAYDASFVGDLTVITKFALINNRRTGNVLSFGLAVTAPSGGSPDLLVAPGVRDEQIRYRGVMLQPFGGWVFNPFSRLFLQGFHGVVVPTDAREPTFMSNGVGLGVWLFRDPAAEFIQGVVPIFEVHVNTPFNHRTAQNIGDTIMGDSVNLTAGAHIVLPRSVFGGAVGVPLDFGPNRIEATATYTLRY
jgi:hypothetical protein